MIAGCKYPHFPRDLLWRSLMSYREHHTLVRCRCVERVRAAGEKQLLSGSAIAFHEAEDMRLAAGEMP